MKPNNDKCHLLIVNNKDLSIKVGNKKIYKKVNIKLHALARLPKYMDFVKLRHSLNLNSTTAHICRGIFNYCPYMSWNIQLLPIYVVEYSTTAHICRGIFNYCPYMSWNIQLLPIYVVEYSTTARGIFNYCPYMPWNIQLLPIYVVEYSFNDIK